MAETTIALSHCPLTHPHYRTEKQNVTKLTMADVNRAKGRVISLGRSALGAKVAPSLRGRQQQSATPG